MTNIYKKRLDKLRRLFVKNCQNNFFEIKEKNIFYLTGLKLGQYPLWVFEDKAYIFLPQMLFSQGMHLISQNGLSGEVIPLLITHSHKGLAFHSLKDAIFYVRETEKIKTIALNLSSMQYNLHKTLSNISELVDTYSFVDEMRMVKDETELKKIRRACLETKLIAEKIPDILIIGKTEKQIAAEIDALSIQKAGDKAFDTIVAFGKNTSFPHYITSDVRYTIEHPEVMVDFGAKFEDYCSDMTRVFGFEKTKNKQLKKIHDIVSDVQSRLLEMVAPGVNAKDIDMKARELLKKHSIDEHFIHGTGHGVGLDIHELLSLSPKSEAVLRKGMVVTIEPGVYLEGIGGVRIEDTVLVTETGFEVLTR